MCLDGLESHAAKVAYDVIDTSILINHVGRPNTLPAVAPLLSRRSTSVLFTDSLLQAAEDPVATLPALLYSDVTMMSLLLGLVPTGHLVRYTTDAVGTESGTRRDPVEVMIPTFIIWELGIGDVAFGWCGWWRVFHDNFF